MKALTGPPFPLCSRLFGLGLFLAGPASGEPRKGAPRLVIHGRADGAEDRTLERGGEQDLGEGHVAVLRLRRLLVVDHAPGLLEQLLAEEARDQAADDAERDEEQLHACETYTRWAARVGVPLQATEEGTSTWRPRRGPGIAGSAPAFGVRSQIPIILGSSGAGRSAGS